MRRNVAIVLLTALAAPATSQSARPSATEIAHAVDSLSSRVVSLGISPEATTTRFRRIVKVSGSVARVQPTTARG